MESMAAAITGAATRIKHRENSCRQVGQAVTFRLPSDCCQPPSRASAHVLNLSVSCCETEDTGLVQAINVSCAITILSTGG